MGQLLATLLFLGLLVPAPAWGAITFRAASSSTTATITKPAGVVSGDVLIAVTFNATAAVITAPAGWVNISSQTKNVPSPNLQRLQMDRLVAGGAEPASYTFTGAAQGIIAAYVGVDNTTPVDVSSLDNAGAAGAPRAASLTTTAANEMLVAGFSDDANVTWTPPAGMTERASLSNSELSDVIQVAAGASGIKEATTTDGVPNIGTMVALKVAGAGGAAPPQRTLVGVGQ